jgi:SAM-dependent methyltransferase
MTNEYSETSQSDQELTAIRQESEALKATPGQSSTVAARVATIAHSVDVSKAHILEIGALDTPTFTRPTHNVAYVDYATREELSKTDNPRYAYERIVEVDYPICGQRYPSVINERFDLVVANHVIEHIPDVITWLHDLGSLLKAGGSVFLSVPDKRYTFDIVRRESNFIDLIRAYLERKTKPDFLNILDHYWHHKEVRAADAWRGDHHGAIERMRFTPDKAFEHAEAMAKKPYADVHVHVFQQNSFGELLQMLRRFGYIGFADASISPVARGSNEFHVVLTDFDPQRAPRFASGEPRSFSG